MGSIVLSRAMGATRATRRRSRATVLSLLVALTAGASLRCGDEQVASNPGPQGTSALFVVPASLTELEDDHFFDHPWPSDLRRETNGTLRLTGFPNRTRTPLIFDYLREMTGKLRGFSPTAAAYVRFTGPLDEASLPASPPATVAPSASVLLVDVDPRSPERGQRKLAQVVFHEPAGVLWDAHTLAVAPAHGHPLRPKTTYAVVATRAVRDREGRPLSPPLTLEEVLGLRGPTTATRALHDAWAPAVAELAAAGVATADLAALTVFTTDDPTEELFRVTDALPGQVAVPKAEGWQAKERYESHDVYEGAYGPSPIYQRGTPPYGSAEEGGDFVFDAEGKPVLQGTTPLRFVLSVPNAARCPMPASGYPVVLYAHGTGGDYRTVVDGGDQVAALVAEDCLAALGIDQVFHGTRPGAPGPSDPNPEVSIALAFFNFPNPLAARTNNRQAALDYVQQARLFTEGHMEVPAAVSRTGQAVKFDGDRIVFWGHSQGGLNGPLYLASHPSARGAVLSGAGSMLTVALLEKTKPEPSIADLVRVLLQLHSDEERAELTLFAPLVNLAQTLLDPTDPVNYERLVIREPRNGHRPKHVYLTVGIGPDGQGDTYAPPRGIQIGAVAMGLPRLAPGVVDVPEAQWGGLADVAVPREGLRGNLAEGRATGVMVQLVPGSSDGHFVLFDNVAARTQAAAFVKSMVTDDVPRLPPLP